MSGRVDLGDAQRCSGGGWDYRSNVSIGMAAACSKGAVGRFCRMCARTHTPVSCVVSRGWGSWWMGQWLEGAPPAGEQSCFGQQKNFDEFSMRIRPGRGMRVDGVSAEGAFVRTGGGSTRGEQRSLLRGAGRGSGRCLLYWRRRR